MTGNRGSTVATTSKLYGDVQDRSIDAERALSSPQPESKWNPAFRLHSLGFVVRVRPLGQGEGAVTRKFASAIAR
jgi:hypothetical protein